MTHDLNDRPDQIDELLADLGAALSVDPSPSVVAGARRRMEARRLRGWTRSWQAASAGAAVVALLGASLLWTRDEPQPLPEMPRVQASAEDVVLPAPVSVTEVVPPQPAARPVRVARSTTRVPLEVVVSPATRLAVEQLQRAIADGRITAESFSGEPVMLEPTVLVPTVLAIEPLELPVMPFGDLDMQPIPPASGRALLEPLS